MVEEHRTSPRNLDEMGVEFFELDEMEVAEWGPGRGGSGPATQVHLLLGVKGVPEARFVLRFKGVDTLAVLIRALTTHGLNVFGRALAQRLGSG